MTVLSKWVSENDCDVVPKQSDLPTLVSDGTSVKKYSYSGCATGRAVEYYQVNGMGHGWPPGSGQAESLAGPSSQNINATDVIWDFFASHPK